jgi:hypothetical protein
MKAHRGFVLLLPMFAMALLSAQQTTSRPTVAEVKAPTLLAPNSATAYDPFFSEGRGFWQRDYLVYVDQRSPRVDLYDKDKNQASVNVVIPGYSDFSLSDATVTPDGRLIISGCSRADVGGKIHCFIGLASRDGHVSPLIDTGRFAPMKINTCDGATVWAIGWLRAPPYFDREGDEPYDVLRLYRLSDGKVIESELPRSTFPLGSSPSRAGFGSPELAMQCRGTTLGIYEGASDEWIEYDASSSKLTRWKLLPQTHRFAQYDSSGNIVPLPVHPTFITGLAMLGSGDVYASFVHQARDGSAEATVGLFQLQKGSDISTWSPIDGTLGSYGELGKFDELCGTDGKNLVYSRFGEHHWFFSSPPH